ncbi:MAG: Lrp/AsnC ligand binding domain-containing protein [Candidatus Bathyarchaeia archaeon]
MALNACILIKTIPIQTDKVVEEASKLAGVRKAFVSYGRYDLVAFVRSGDYSGIRKLTAAVNEIDGVRSTETLVEA